MRTLLCAAVLGGVGLLLAGGAAAAAGQTHVDNAGGYRITIPRDWQVVPRTVKAVKALAAKLQKQKQTGLAGQLRAIVADPNVAQDLKLFRFQAFQWPPPAGPIQTDVQIRVDSVPAHVKASARALAVQDVKSLRGMKGATAQAPAKVRLPAGTTYRVHASLPTHGAKSRTGFTLYVLLHRRRVYAISFRCNDTLSAGLKARFLTIVRSLRFV